jgi:hypothetical protein
MHLKKYQQVQNVYLSVWHASYKSVCELFLMYWIVEINTSQIILVFLIKLFFKKWSGIKPTVAV